MNSESCTESVSPPKTAQNCLGRSSLAILRVSERNRFPSPPIESRQNCIPKRFELHLSFRTFNRLPETSIMTSGTETTATSGSTI
jgi:hypothetical protein